MRNVFQNNPSKTKNIKKKVEAKVKEGFLSEQILVSSQ